MSRGPQLGEAGGLTIQFYPPLEEGMFESLPKCTTVLDSPITPDVPNVVDGIAREGENLMAWPVVVIKKVGSSVLQLGYQSGLPKADRERHIQELNEHMAEIDPGQQISLTIK